MTDKEKRELDAWIAEHVFGWDLDSANFPSGYDVAFCGYPPDSKRWRGIALPHVVPHYTTDPAAIMEVLKKCADVTNVELSFWNVTRRWSVGSQSLDGPEKADTLELAICQFAKRLFEK